MARIMVCGSLAGVGKDHFARRLVMKHGYEAIAFADPIYKICYEVFDMQGKDRKLLQQVGEGLREIDPDVWAKWLLRKIKSMGDNIVVTDLRRRNEHDLCLEQGFIPVRIVADRDVCIQRLIERDGKCDVSLLDNKSETGTRDIPMTEIENNDTLVDFYKKVDRFVKSLEG